MPKINEYVNIKPVEMVHEIKNEYQILTFEEFMKSYQTDENLNYSDLGYSDIGASKGYGPTSDRLVTYYFRGVMVIDENFCLNVECLNWQGSGLERPITSISGAQSLAHRLEDGYLSNVSSEVEKKCAVLIREAVAHRNAGNRVNGYVRVKGKFWGSYEWSYSY